VVGLLALAEVEDILIDLSRWMKAASRNDLLGTVSVVGTVVYWSATTIDVVDFAVVAPLPFKLLQVVHETSHIRLVLASTTSFYVRCIVLR